MGNKKGRTLSERVAFNARVGGDRRRSLYVAARKLAAPKTTARRTRVAREVKSDLVIPEQSGFLLVERGRFAEADELVTAGLARLAEVGDPSAGRDPNKRFLVPILERDHLTGDSPYMRFALRDDVLRAVTAYLGVVPILSSVNVYYSPAVEAGLASSQLFHCDGDDTRQVKIFVLCTEVTPENGPLTVMRASESEQVRRKIGYQYRNRVRDEEAEAAVGTPDLHEVVGPPGTSAFVDTSRCFHYGSRVEAGAAPRLAAIIQYLTPFSFMLPRDFHGSAPYADLASERSSQLERLVLGAA